MSTTVGSPLLTASFLTDNDSVHISALDDNALCEEVPVVLLDVVHACLSHRLRGMPEGVGHNPQGFETIERRQPLSEFPW